MGTICRYGMVQRLDYSLNTRTLNFYASVFIIRRENGRFSLTLYLSTVTVCNLPLLTLESTKVEVAS